MLKRVVILNTYKSFVFAAFLLCMFTANAQVNAPSVRCISVDLANTDVTINWVIPADPTNQFESYHIYRANNINGPYTVIDSIFNYFQATYTDVGASPTVTTRFYYIRTRFNQAGLTFSNPSDTITPIIPNINTTTPGVSLVTWNPFIVPNTATSTGNYTVFRAVNAAAPAMVGNSTYGNQVFTENLAFCNANVSYRITIGDASGCTSVSATALESFIDITPPNIPTIDSISVDLATGLVMIGWTHSTSPDRAGYIVAYNDAGTWVLDTINSPVVNNYVHPSTDGNLGPQTISLAAFDTCNNLSASGTNHVSVFLTASADMCERNINLSWTPYVGWSGVANYLIFLSVNGSPYVLHDAVNGTETSYSHDNVDADKIYCYFVRAVNEVNPNIRSSSNGACGLFSNIVLPDKHYLTHVTVVSNTQVDLEAYVDTMPGTIYFSVKRAFDFTGPFREIARIEQSNDTLISYSDTEAKPDQTSHYYRVDAIDSCDQTLVSSYIHRTIHLEGDASSNQLVAKLKWNLYANWEPPGGDVSLYYIHRAFSENGDYEIIDSVSSLLTEYTDIIYDDAGKGAHMCYYIEAVEGDNNMYEFKKTSVSNVQCFSFDYSIYIPNAFTPNNDGNNERFVPVLNFVDTREYTLTIFSRAGDIVFETNNADIGWDGRNMDGSMAGLGVYVYQISATSSYGARIIRRGSIQLIR